MYSFGKLAVLGGDARMTVAAEYLKRRGWTVERWGGTADTVGSWQEAVSDAAAILLPLPSSSDGVRIHCPTSIDAQLRFFSLIKALKAGTLVLGGRLSEIWCRQAEEAGVVAEDYYLSEVFQLKNALPTAEGAISLALNALPVTLQGSQFAVIGYGRIASLLAEKLHLLGGKVTVYARKERDLAHAEIRGLRAVRLDEDGGGDAFLEIDRDTRMIFNTVPSRILTEPALRRLPSTCILMELASPPGGFDPAVADRLGLKWMLASALPGKCFPESAGIALAQTVESRLEARLRNG